MRKWDKGVGGKRKERRGEGRREGEDRLSEGDTANE